MKTRAALVVAVSVCVLALLGTLCLSPVMAQTQPQTQPQTRPQTAQDKKKQQEEYDTPYTDEEYAAYEAATKEADPAKRQALLIKFTKDYPKSALKEYIVASYKQLLKDLFDRKQYALLAPAAEGYLATFDPNDLVSVAMAAESYRNLGNHQKYIEFELRVFSTQPSGADAYNITKAYEALQDQQKYEEWAKKTMEMLPVTTPANYPIHLEFVTRLMQAEAEKKQLGKAAEYAQKLIPLLEKAPKPDSASAQEWKEYVNKEQLRGWSLIGEAHYEKEKWKDTMAAYDKVLTLARRNDLAHYRIGLCHWKLEDPDAAIESFARAYVLNGAFAKNAYEYLERLYKALHNNTTVGLNRVIDQARKEVGG